MSTRTSTAGSTKREHEGAVVAGLVSHPLWPHLVELLTATAMKGDRKAAKTLKACRRLKIPGLVIPELPPVLPALPAPARSTRILPKPPPPLILALAAALADDGKRARLRGALGLDDAMLDRIAQGRCELSPGQRKAVREVLG